MNLLSIPPSRALPITPLPSLDGSGGGDGELKKKVVEARAKGAEIKVSPPKMSIVERENQVSSSSDLRNQFNGKANLLKDFDKVKMILPALEYEMGRQKDESFQNAYDA